MEFSLFLNKIQQHFRLNLGGYKEKQLKRRIDGLMIAQNVSGYGNYYRLLIADQNQRKRFFDKVTINVSEFFRNPDIFKFLEREIFPGLLKRKKTLKVWSAACSIGAEPYSVAIILDEMTPGLRHRIEASDIDETALEKARLGKYDAKNVRNVSLTRLKKYFRRYDDYYEISPEIKRKIIFKKHDLLLDPYGKNYDLILCRNVTIYFKADVQKKIYRLFFDALNEGGILFTGATENIFNYQEVGYERASPWFYRKPY